MPNPGSVEVGQRRFWNMLRDRPGIMYIGGLGIVPEAVLTSDTGFLAPLTIFANGPIDFPVEHKLARIWRLDYRRSSPPLGSVDYDGPSQWVFKPYSTKWSGGIGPNQGDDWNADNLFSDAHNMPTSLHYYAEGDTPPGTKLGIAWAYDPGSGAQGWGTGGRLYGYLNDHYFGNNEMGGNKPNEGIGPQTAAIGDLSKTYSGLWGAFGISHGTCINAVVCETTAFWEFDLCHRPQMMALSLFNNQIYHLNEDTYQSEGWGTDVVAIHENTIEKMDGSQETYRQFTVEVSPARSTMNVYTPKGKMLEYGVDYIHDECDRSGRSYRLLDTPLTDPQDPCERPFVLVVTYLVVAQSLRSGRHPGRQTDPSVAHDRIRENDVRGL
jgi:hypothetical protein